MSNLTRIQPQVSLIIHYTETHTNELFHNILIYRDAPVYIYIYILFLLKYVYTINLRSSTI